MSKYIKLDDAMKAILFPALDDLPTIEVSEKVEDERCKGCKHYKLACDLFSEICKYEPITHTETQNSNLTFEIADTPKAKVSEDCIGREYLEEEYWQTLIPKEMINTDVELGINIGIDKMHDVIKNAPSVVPIAEQYSTDGEVDLGDCNIYNENNYNEENYCGTCLACRWSYTVISLAFTTLKCACKQSERFNKCVKATAACNEYERIKE